MFSDNYAIKLEINSKRSKNIHVSDHHFPVKVDYFYQTSY